MLMLWLRPTGVDTRVWLSVLWLSACVAARVAEVAEWWRSCVLCVVWLSVWLSERVAARVCCWLSVWTVRLCV